MNDQERLWAGEFGNHYTARNRVDWHKRTRFWRDIVDHTKPQAMLEIGCNAGWNLHALAACGVPTLVGLDINHDAVREAQLHGLNVIHGTPDLCDSITDKFDVVFTCGVLIHIGPEKLSQTMQAAVASSKRYVLAVEYEDVVETEVRYRGVSNALWRRDYGALYEAIGLRRIDYGHLGEYDGFDPAGVTFWLMEKR